MTWTLAMPADAPCSTGRQLARLSGVFVLIALCCLPFADLAIYRAEPWQELGRLALGLVTPAWQGAGGELVAGLAQTVAFALLGVAVSALVGLGLALYFEHRAIRVFSAAIRSVHEIFWGLIFMQIYGLSPLTGLLAIAVPYSGIFAKVFAEILARQWPTPGRTLAPNTHRLSRFAYTLLPQAWPELMEYVRYRFECGLRSSAILGFIGLPTIGFYLESAFKQGEYSEAGALLLVFFLLIASLRFWLRPWLIPVYLLVALWLLPDAPPVLDSYVWQFLTQDIWPAPLLAGDLPATLLWYGDQLHELALPALWQTLLLSQLALVLTGVVTLALYPLASRQIVGRWHWLGQAFLLALRSTPEMILAFVFLLLLGPSGLPLVLALALHNGGLLAYLLSRQCDRLPSWPDEPRGANRYLYQTTPGLYRPFLALLLYRWEVILRESAILGVLGVATLGFYVDSAFEAIRYDRAAFLILITAALNILVDAVSRRLRASDSLDKTHSGVTSVKADLEQRASVVGGASEVEALPVKRC